MIELTEQHRRALDVDGDQPPLVVDPRTQEPFVLVRKDVYDAVQRCVGPLKRRWDKPADDDLIGRPSRIRG